MDNMALVGDSLAEAVGMPGGAAEDVLVYLVLGTVSVTPDGNRKEEDCKLQTL